MRQALGLIGTVGYVPAVAAVDAAAKTARVSLLGLERVIGAGKAVTVTVKLSGDVANVQAAVEAGVSAARAVGEVFAYRVIPRPHDDVDGLIRSAETKASLRSNGEIPEGEGPLRGPVEKGQRGKKKTDRRVRDHG
jgi:ethanolamine utilization protein EutM